MRHTVPAAALALACLLATPATTAVATPTASRAPASPSISTSVSTAGALGASEQPADRRAPRKVATSIGRGGAVSTVDPYATRVGLRVLRSGGNAVDAAVAAAAALGVTEPYSAGIGGGGYFVHYDADTGKVRTLDGRETAPRGIRPDAFIDPATGAPYNFSPELVTSGVSVGVPGTLATWKRALDRWGTRSLARSLRPAARLARRGFVVDARFRQLTADNAARFAAIRPTARLFLRGGQPPRVGTVFRNRALARTYDLIARRGVRAFYRGEIAGDIVRAVRRPPKTGSTTLPVPPGSMNRADLRRYRVIARRATRVGYRGLGVYGMPPSSSGGTTVGEALNILERYPLSSLPAPAFYHHYFEASALAFADRGRYLGDPRFVSVPVRALLDDRFAAERSCSLNPLTAAPKPVPAGDVTSYDGVCPAAPRPQSERADTENRETTNLTVVDRWGNVVEYTLTIEQTGGSGIVVPRRGFLLNNELTDFSTVYDPADPNRIQPGKRPRSSMSPTIVKRDGKAWLALGSPGGSTIITTVLQILLERVDRGLSLPQAVAAPRATNRNTARSTAEQAFIDRYGTLLAAFGQELTVAGAPGSSASEIGAATAIEIGRRGRLTAVAEPVRRGGGTALVVRPRR